MPNANADKLTDAQKKLLKEVHLKYGEVGKSHLLLVVHEGDQTLNLELK